MEVSVENTSTVERKLTVVVPAAEVDDKVTKKVRETQKQARIAGFRPGKVPEREIRRRFGDSIRQEVLADVIQTYYVQALEQQSLSPVDMPRIDFNVNEAGKDLEFVATIEVKPEIELPDLSTIEVERVSSDIDDADVDTMIEQIRSQAATWEEKTDGAAESGDRITYDFLGTIDGEAFEGGSADNSTLELGSNTMIPGFEDQLIGVKLGEERVLKVNFPEDYHAEELKGKAAEFKTTTHKIESKELPALEDGFFERFGVTEGGEPAFREEIKKNMERQRSVIEHQIMTNNATIEILKNNQFEVPKALVEKEAKKLRDQSIEQVFKGNVPDALKNNPDMIPYTGFMNKATHTVRTGFLLADLIEKNEIKATDEQKEAKLDYICENYENPEQVKESIRANPDQMQGLEQQVLEELVIEFIASQVSLTEVKLSFKELSEYELKEPEFGEEADEVSEESAAEEGGPDGEEATAKSA